MNTTPHKTCQPAPSSPQQQAVFAQIRREAETKIKANDLLVAKIQKQTSLNLEDFITEVAREQMKLEGF